MGDCFVVMQIGDEQMDMLWQKIYIPAIEDLGLSPKRVDIDDDGTLIKPQIIRYLQESELILADLTNQRPNCYLEVGYLMGLNRYEQLIICAREDHNQDSPNYVKGGPKIHFDLRGYGITWWDPRNLGNFKIDLMDKMKRRLKRTVPAPQVTKQTGIAKIGDWVEQKRKEAFEIWKKS